MQFVRAETSLECIVAMLVFAANTRQHGLPALSEAYASIAELQMQVLHCREAVGSGTLRLPALVAAVEQGIATGQFSSVTRDILAAVRRRLGVEPGTKPGAGGSAELDKLIGRI